MKTKILIYAIVLACCYGVHALPPEKDELIINAPPPPPIPGDDHQDPDPVPDKPRTRKISPEKLAKKLEGALQIARVVRIENTQQLMRAVHVAEVLSDAYANLAVEKYKKYKENSSEPVRISNEKTFKGILDSNRSWDARG
jgi:hypothetical protein